MVRQVTTKRVSPGAHVGFLLKAEELLASSKRELGDGQYNAAAVLAVHSVISACDAVCAKVLGERYSGADHMAAVNLLKQLPFDAQEVGIKVQQAVCVLDIKNKAEYSDILIKQDASEQAVKQAERLLEWVRAKASKNGQ